jgi:hypothetical protein
LEKRIRTIPPLRIAAHANWMAMGIYLEEGKKKEMSVLYLAEMIGNVIAIR